MDIITWTYTEMSAIDPEVSIHRLSIRADRRPIKQGPRRMHLDLAFKVGAGVDILIKAYS